MSSRHDKVRCELCRKCFKVRSGGFINHLRFCKQRTLQLHTPHRRSRVLGPTSQLTGNDEVAAVCTGDTDMIDVDSNPAYKAHDSTLQLPNTGINMAIDAERTAPRSNAGPVPSVVREETHQIVDSDDKVGPNMSMDLEDQPNEMTKAQPPLLLPPGDYSDVGLDITASVIQEALAASIKCPIPIIPPYIQLYRKPLVHHYVDGSGRIRKRHTITMKQVREMYKHAFQHTASAYVVNFLGISGIAPDQWPEPDSEFIKAVNHGQFPLVDGEIFRNLPAEHLRGDWSYPGITRWTACLAGVIQKDFMSKYLRGCFTPEEQPSTKDLHEFANGAVFSALILHMKEVRSRYCDKHTSILKWLDSIEPTPLEETESQSDAQDQVKDED
ncbi:hypothetical protein CPB86DRAFT_820856 [Serendipita vermifera]|nr:hypothetical protein CPB86DRAFT_820856 [Serendipita vermifera]